MIKKYCYTEQEVVSKSSELIHLFYDRDIEQLTQMLHKDFVWIGAYEFQFIIGREEFLNSIESEIQEQPVQVTLEEYHLLSHEKNQWTVYGRFTATVIQQDGTILMAKVRNTFIWKEQNNQLLSLHIHGSNANDVPLQYQSMPPSPINCKPFFDYIKDADCIVRQPKRIGFHTTDGNYRFLLPTDILYMKSEKKHSIIVTTEGSFVTKMSLKDMESKSHLFYLIHRSYIANIRYITTIYRYKCELQSGDILPISKEKYLDVRGFLY